jgi:hypothetical protein
MKITLTTVHYWSDWTTIEKQDIETDNYDYFSIELRCDSWYLLGHKYDNENDRWITRSVLKYDWYGITEEFHLLSDKIFKITTNNNNGFISDLTNFLKKVDK